MDGRYSDRTQGDLSMSRGYVRGHKVVEGEPHRNRLAPERRRVSRGDTNKRRNLRTRTMGRSQSVHSSVEAG